MAKNMYGNVISSPVSSFNGGLDTRLPENAASNTFNAATNVSVTTQGVLEHRPGTKKWLPDAIGTVYQVYPAYYNQKLYYFICDNGMVRYCQDGDTAWTNCGGSNTVTTGLGIRYQFLHVEDQLYIVNGKDTSRYVDLATMTVVLFAAVADPTAAPTAAAFGTGLTYATTSTATTNFPIYYSITFNGPLNETKNSPILTGYASLSRTDWAGTNAYGLTVTRNNAAPAGARSWNLYMASASGSGSIINDDMLLLASGLPLSATTFNDNGSLQPNLNHGTAPNDNSTAGFIANYGEEIEGRLFLWGIVGDEYAIRIGGDPGNALDFTPSNGGYRLVSNKGTNYFPTNVVSFRNSQGIPSLTTLYSNTQGTSKQAVLSSSTLNYGGYQFVVWGVEDQGRNVPAGNSPYAVFAYNNSLYFPTNSAVMELTTKPTVSLLVLSVGNISIPIADLYQTINADQLANIVGCGINDRIYFSCAVNGFPYNNIILVYDFTDLNNPKWYPWNITQQWVGVISPPASQVFLYVCQDNHIFKLEKGPIAVDEDTNGFPTPFHFGATGPLMGTNTDHSAYLALVQAVFYLVNVVGNVEVSVRYSTASPSGLVKYNNRSKTVTGPPYVMSDDGNWSDYRYEFLPAESPLLAWGETAVFNESDNQQPPSNYRPPVPINQVVNEAQWSFSSDPVAASGATLRSVSYEGVTIGPKADIQ
jgi:hypothetical protein